MFVGMCETVQQVRVDATDLDTSVATPLNEQDQRQPRGSTKEERHMFAMTFLEVGRAFNQSNR